MIIDYIGNAAAYAALHPLFEAAFAFLRSPEAERIVPGRHERSDLGFAVIAERGPGRKPAEAPLEAHRRYIDIQYVTAGTDMMGWKPLSACAAGGLYDGDRDVQFLADAPDVWLPVHPGTFAIFFPDDAHAPLVGDGVIEKIILKIPVATR